MAPASLPENLVCSADLAPLPSPNPLIRLVFFSGRPFFHPGPGRLM
jgi:hypothetical protein